MKAVFQGNLLALEMKRQRYSDVLMAELTGLNKATLWKYKTNKTKRVSGEALIRICHVLNCDPRMFWEIETDA